MSDILRTAPQTRWPFAPITRTPDLRLLPCPFCGSSALLAYRPTHKEWFCMCGGSGCGAVLAKQNNKGFGTEVAAVEAWNRRSGGA